MQFWLAMKINRTVAEDLVSFIVLFDIPYNFIVQHKKDDEQITQTIVESTQFYLWKRFIPDIVSSLVFWQFLFTKP